MKKLKITVNGTTYDVVVEEQNSESNDVVSSQPVIKSISESKNSDQKVSLDQGSEKIKAPMPGSIMSVNVSKGQLVKRGEVLFVLEAMKMENEIMCPRDGEVASINVNKGDNVDSGAILMSLI